ncbi:MAG: Asp-tRNA(Asn)/Glu-tRNA(Gln) amidotransferase subunit GatA [Myxococcales bacterium]|nr:Asp-tRNA(Asn)/Glu-tRNA(Gln) amidotransferase subunit GatA [Myxococcales bacterium]
MSEATKSALSSVSWTELSIAEQAARVSRGELSAVELCRHYLTRIERLDVALRSFLHVDAEGALAQAAAVDAARAAGEALGPLAGVPLSLKDNLCTRGLATSCASRILEGYIPPYDAHVVERLREAGAVILGKSNLDEFAMGSSTENSAFGASKNPWDPKRVPGGSSGGSAAATAARLAAASLGSDTGGSVRQPAAYCGVTAIKPSYGRVSRYGLVAFASSLDQVGPIARDVADAATLLGVIAGHDRRDATSVEREVPDYAAECGRDPKGLRVGVVREAIEGCEASVRAAIETAMEALSGLGCELVEVELPNASHSIAAYYIIAPAEASSNLARFDGMRYGLRVAADDLAATYRKTRSQGFGAEVRRRIMLGTYALSAGYFDAYYLKAQRVRTRIRQDFDAAFERCDLLLTPTAPTVAFESGAHADPLSMYKQDIFTLPASLAGVAALSMPCGLGEAGLPVGLQLSAPAFEEAPMIRMAHALERQLGVLPLTPPGYGGEA